MLGTATDLGLAPLGVHVMLAYAYQTRVQAQSCWLRLGGREQGDTYHTGLDRDLKSNGLGLL